MVVGCYDGSIHGWTLDITKNSSLDSLEETLTVNNFKLSFSYTSHEGCIKALAIQDFSQSQQPLTSERKRKRRRKGKVKANTYLVSGGTDETIKVYSLTQQKNEEYGEITEHTNTITSLAFLGDQQEALLSGCEDGKILLWRTYDWNEIAEFKGHKSGSVTNLVVHPNNQLFFSTSRDNSLRLWDATTSKAASRNKLEKCKVVQDVVWSYDGQNYAVLCDDHIVMVFDVNNSEAKPFFLLTMKERIASISFLSCSNEENSKQVKNLLLALENGILEVFELSQSEVDETKEHKPLISCDLFTSSKEEVEDENLQRMRIRHMKSVSLQLKHPVSSTEKKKTENGFMTDMVRVDLVFLTLSTKKVSAVYLYKDLKENTISLKIMKDQLQVRSHAHITSLCTGVLDA